MKCCNCDLSIGVCYKFDSFGVSFLGVFLDLNCVLNVITIILLLEVTNLSFLFNSEMYHQDQPTQVPQTPPTPQHQHQAQ